MKMIPAAGGLVPAAPMVAFDPKSPYALWYLIALLSWPKDQRQQAYALTTYASELIGFYDDHGPTLAANTLQGTVARVAARLGIPEAEVLAMPQARMIAEHLREHLDNVKASIETDMFEPAGGHRVVARAPGVDVLRGQIQKATDGGARSVGWALLLVATMQRRHPELNASLNRAFAIMEATCLERDWPGLSERTLKDQWEGWRDIAPLSAALWTWTLGRPPGASRDEWLAAAFRTETGVKAVLRWARWFRRFGTTHKARGSRATLLSEAETIDYRVDLPPMEPNLPNLTPRELAAAKAYKVVSIRSA